jgi:predicted short-subunit dehydrogenase-like oxidoreductase (DUF2520 family)
VPGTRGAASAVALRVFVLGAGRAGLGLARAVSAAMTAARAPGPTGRPAGRGRRRCAWPPPLTGVPPLGEVTAGALPAPFDQASVVFVAVQDRALEGALGEVEGRLLARRGDRRPLPVVLQASGSADPAAFARLRALGVGCGTFHPLVPLAVPERAPGLLRGRVDRYRRRPTALDAAHAMAEVVGAHPLRIAAGEKARYHAAAVFASNFPIVLAAVAERLLAAAGIDELGARSAVRHLLSSSAANLAGGDDAALALTGPVVRGDADTVAKHLGALGGDPSALTLYQALARETVALAERAGADHGALADIIALLTANRPQ